MGSRSEHDANQALAQARHVGRMQGRALAAKILDSIQPLTVAIHYEFVCNPGHDPYNHTGSKVGLLGNPGSKL